MNQAFTKFRVTETLKNLLLNTNSRKLKTDVIHALANIKDASVIPFLLEILQDQDHKIKAEGIFACGLFQDPAVAYFLEKFLDDSSSKVRSNTIIALWQFVTLRLKLLTSLIMLLDSDN